VIPNAPRQPNDVIDLLCESVQQVKERYDENGNMQLILEPDNESLYWRTMLINNPNFGGCVLEVKNWQGIADSAEDNMCVEPARILKRQMLAISDGYKYAFASKSSETIRDRNNSQSSLTHILQRNHMEKTVTIEDKMKKGLGESIGLGGRDDQQQQTY
jgi:hypothetical protein